MSNHFLYKEAVYAGYIQLQGKVGENNRFETGFRIEHTHINGNMLEYASLSDSAFYDRYTNFFPFMSMEYLLPDKARLAITYGSRIVRPNYKDLNPFVSINDRYLFNQGNVNLKPEISQQLELALLLKKRYRIVVFGTYTHNPISKSYYSDDNNRACVYPLNLSSDYACGIRLTGINLHPWPWWTINANAVCIYKKYAWLNEKKKYDNEVITPMLYAGNQYKITHGGDDSVEYQLHLSAYVSPIYRSADHQCITKFHLFGNLMSIIFRKNAGSCCAAAHTAGAGTNLQVVHIIPMNISSFNMVDNGMEHCRYSAFFSRTAVYN